MKKLISLSLWGDNKVYTIGAVRFAEQSIEIFPDWDVRYYVSSDVPQQIIFRLRELGCQIVEMQKGNEWAGLFWRYYPIIDNVHDCMLFRDCDCRPSFEEKEEVDKWIESGKGVGTIHGHPYHFTVPILGGLFGIRKNACPQFGGLLKKWQHISEYQDDQNFLTSQIFPLVIDNVFDSDMLSRSPSSDYSFIGEPYNEHDEPLNRNFRSILRNYHETLSFNQTQNT